MRILLIECDAEELRANRTVLDNINEALSSFTRNFAGVDIGLSKEEIRKYLEEESENGEEELEEEV